MKTNTGVVILIILIAILFFLFFTRCDLSRSSEEKFGQDASIRAQSGWIAGPIYGYDPVSHFAKQIEEMKKHYEYLRSKGIPIEKSELVMYSGYPNLVSDPEGDVGPFDHSNKKVPLEKYQESHPPYTKKCIHQPDCWEGETCYLGTCIPADLEPYQKGHNPKKECKSCMTTEEFNM